MTHTPPRCKHETSDQVPCCCIYVLHRMDQASKGSSQEVHICLVTLTCKTVCAPNMLCDGQLWLCAAGGCSGGGLPRPVKQRDQHDHTELLAAIVCISARLHSQAVHVCSRHDAVLMLCAPSNFCCVQRGDAEVVGFHALPSNVTNMITMLDKIRARPEKFLCLNDDMGDDANDVTLFTVGFTLVQAASVHMCTGWHDWSWWCHLV